MLITDPSVDVAHFGIFRYYAGINGPLNFKDHIFQFQKYGDYYGTHRV